MLDRVLAGPGDPCSIVWLEERKDWVQFDEFCGDIMQFTGLKDKNDKEVYEGDILRVRFGKHTVEVRWNVTGFGFFNLGTHQWQLLYVSDLKQIEVIGNIYEHSDLLQKEV